MIKKKSQGMPVNVIIIAALGILVLFVLIIIFTGQTRKAVTTLESCEGVGGRCTLEGESCNAATEIPKTNTKCPKETQKCCIKIYEDKK